MENLSKMDDLGGKPIIFGNTRIRSRPAVIYWGMMMNGSYIWGDLFPC